MPLDITMIAVSCQGNLGNKQGKWSHRKAHRPMLLIVAGGASDRRGVLPIALLG